MANIFSCIFCSICIDDLSTSNEWATLDCGHVFHQLCLAEWRKISFLCPNCKSWGHRLIRLYFNEQRPYQLLVLQEFLHSFVNSLKKLSDFNGSNPEPNQQQQQQIIEELAALLQSVKNVGIEENARENVFNDVKTDLSMICENLLHSEGMLRKRNEQICKLKQKLKTFKKNEGNPIYIILKRKRSKLANKSSESMQKVLSKVGRSSGHFSNGVHSSNGFWTIS